MQEQRPVYNIAVAGLDPRDVRLIEIVFKHSQYNRFEFVLVERIDPHLVDVLVVNPVVPEGLQAVTVVRGMPRHVPVIAAVPRGVPSPARHAISIDRLTLQLLPILNRVVESELLSQDTQPMTLPMAHDDARFAGADPQPDASGPPRRHQASRPSSDASPASASSPVRSPGFAGAPAAFGTSATPETSAAAVAASAAAQPAAQATGPQLIRQPGAAAPAEARAMAPRPAGPDAARPPLPGSPAVARAPAGAVGESQGRRADATAARAAGASAARVADRPVVRIRVLVVDDSPTVRQQLGLAFGRMGLACEMVPSGQQALARLDAGRYDLVMADVVIPDMDGYRLTREIRKHHRGTPVIILSSRSSPFDYARGLLAGCKAYLAKPVTLRELEATMLKVLRKSMPPAAFQLMLRNAAAARAAAQPSAGSAASAASAAPARSAAPAGPHPVQPARPVGASPGQLRQPARPAVAAQAKA